MEYLENKSYPTETRYKSRYVAFPYYYHTLDDKYIAGKTAWFKENTGSVEVSVDEYTTLDSLALKYYGRPDYFWIIADYNQITDPFIKLSEYFSSIKIPNYTNLQYRGY